VRVRDLPLPPELIVLIEAGRWKSPTDESGLDRLFPERSEFCCYSLTAMVGETRTLDRFRDPMWHGTPDPANPPGDIDPSRAVFIADLGIGYDQPIALDYRSSLAEPRVLTLSWNKPDPPIPWEHVGPWREGKRTFDRVTTERLQEWWDITEVGGWNRWIEIAPDFATFTTLIHISLCDFPRDASGNPFRPAAFDAAWRTQAAVALARQMYESRDFGAMPILADALQDAGCTSDDILDHCRGPGPHVRGCWVVDLVLGKE
jgi:hypothetical protein